MRHVVITGASGFLGAAVVAAARAVQPTLSVTAVDSPSEGGIDLTAPDAAARLQAAVRLDDPGATVLIHAAARVRWDAPEGLLANAAMAVNVASWGREAGVGFAVLVSAVNVFATRPFTPGNAPCRPPSMYGVGKLAAEHAWRVLLPPQRRTVVRLAGIWGWQRRPTLFWNRLLLRAAGIETGAALVVRRRRSRRNYISAREASACLLGLAADRVPGVFLAAGLDVVSVEQFVEAVATLPGSRVDVDWQDDGGSDEIVYETSPELRRWLRPFPEELAAVWAARPAWVLVA